MAGALEFYSTVEYVTCVLETLLQHDELHSSAAAAGYLGSPAAKAGRSSGTGGFAFEGHDKDYGKDHKVGSRAEDVWPRDAQKEQEELYAKVGWVGASLTPA